MHELSTEISHIKVPSIPDNCPSVSGVSTSQGSVTTNSTLYINSYSIKITTHRFFETFIILAILGNSIVLAMNDYKDKENLLKWNQNLNQLSNLFTWLFLAESILKILA